MVWTRAASFVIALAALASNARAQSVISAHSGVVQYVEGKVTIDGAAIHPKFAEFPEVKSGQVIAAEEGRVEMLLTPGVFLRLAENSSVRMLSNSLADTRLEVISGSALIEVGELLEHNAISFEAAGAHLALGKKGLYRIDASPASLRVYEGQALVTSGSENLTAKKSHQIDLASAKFTDTRFDVKDTDPFHRWSARRAEYVAAANVISARVTSNSDYRSGFTGNQGAWSWNPYFGMYTFLPANGIYWSPFGSAFYSPGVIANVYMPQRRGWMGNGGGAGMPVSAPSGGGGAAGNVGSARGMPGGSLHGGGGSGAPVSVPGSLHSGGGYSGGTAPSAGGHSGTRGR